ncbi:response regulator [Paenibacillus sp. MBLB4367]|uniref:response regulator n=1 Tax=Paenibacillus sp. MBLB4367 TaxID=3384767 RepID=UPI003907F7F3
MNILLVDDEEHVIDGLREMIDWEALHIDRVFTAADGEEAWQLYCSHRPDVVLTDVAMPQMNGLELSARIRREDPHVPIVILSGYDDFEYAREAVHLSVSRYILKPAVFTEIQEMLAEVIGELEAVRKQKQYADEFSRQMKHSIPLLREQLLFDLVVTGGAVVTAEQLRFHQLEDELLTGGLVVTIGLYRTDDARFASERDWQLFKFSVANIVSETIAAADGIPGGCFLLRYVEDRLPLLVISGDPGEAVLRARRLAEAFLESVTRYLGIELNVAIGGWFGKAGQYRASYVQCCDMLRSLDFEGYHRIVSADDENDYAASMAYDPLKAIRLLSGTFRQGGWGEAAEMWREMRGALLRESVPLGVAQIAAVSLMSGLTLELAEEERENANRFLPIVQDIYKHRSKEAVLQLVEDHLNALLEQFRQREAQQRPSHDCVRKLIEQIESRFAEPLSFSELARQLHMTRNHLSYLFKRETGTSFVAYLTSYRIERAKELLNANRYMIYEIAEKVGYSDGAYFSRVFKNATGVCPLEYTHSQRQ